MSEPIRYGMTWHTDEDDFVYVSPKEQADGQWVKYDDYARLKAEVHLLEEIVGSDAIDRKYGMCCDSSTEIARLKAEVERSTAQYNGIIDTQLKAIDDLKAEVERLKKPAVIGGYNISEYIRMANSETLEFDNGDIFADMTLPERIKYIIESHARLKAELDRLKNTDPNSITGSTIIDDPSWSIACFRFHRENERAEIARLRKAGDNLERVLTSKVASYEVANASHEWLAAKEGKQS